jgi:hypothetical protein
MMRFALAALPTPQSTMPSMAVRALLSPLPV